MIYVEPSLPALPREVHNNGATSVFFPSWPLLFLEGTAHGLSLLTASSNVFELSSLPYSTTFATDPWLLASHRAPTAREALKELSFEVLPSLQYPNHVLNHWENQCSTPNSCC